MLFHRIGVLSLIIVASIFVINSDATEKKILKGIAGFYVDVYIPPFPEDPKTFVTLVNRLQTHAELKLRQFKVPVRSRDQNIGITADTVPLGWAKFQVEILPIALSNGKYAFVVESSVSERGATDRKPKEKYFVQTWGFLNILPPTDDINEKLMSTIDADIEKMLNEYLASNE